MPCFNQINSWPVYQQYIEIASKNECAFRKDKIYDQRKQSPKNQTQGRPWNKEIDQIVYHGQKIDEGNHFFRLDKRE